MRPPDPGTVEEPHGVACVAQSMRSRGPTYRPLHGDIRASTTRLLLPLIAYYDRAAAVRDTGSQVSAPSTCRGESASDAAADAAEVDERLLRRAAMDCSAARAICGGHTLFWRPVLRINLMRECWGLPDITPYSLREGKLSVGVDVILNTP